MRSSPYTIVMFPQRKYPCDHAMLESVYTRVLPARGHQVVWVMEARSGSANATASWNGTTVHLLPCARASRWTPLASITRFWRAVRTGVRIAAQQPVDIVQVRNELMGACAALVMRRKFGMPFVYQLSFPLVAPHLLDPDATRSTLWLKRLGMGAKRALQWRVLRAADLVLAISDQMRAELIAEGIPPERVVSFPLGVDTNVQPGAYDATAIRDQLGLGDAPTFIYFGAMDRLRRLDFLLDVMVRVLAEVPAARLLMLGTAEKEEDLLWLKAQTAQRALEHAVHFLGAVPRAQVPLYLSAAHLSVAPYPALPVDISRSPTKVIESLGMAIPVVANSEIPDQRTVISESGGGRCVAYNTEAFARAVIEYLRDPAAAREAGLRGREYVQHKRSYSVLADDIETWYAQLLSGPTNQVAARRPSSATGDMRQSARTSAATQGKWTGGA